MDVSYVCLYEIHKAHHRLGDGRHPCPKADLQWQLECSELRLLFQPNDLAKTWWRKGVKLLSSGSALHIGTGQCLLTVSYGSKGRRAGSSILRALRCSPPLVAGSVVV